MISNSVNDCPKVNACSITQSAPKICTWMKIKPIHIWGHRLHWGIAPRQCTELILMIWGQHPCYNYTFHIRPHFARVIPLNLFACTMRELNEMLSFINAVIYIYDKWYCGHAIKVLSMSVAIWSEIWQAWTEKGRYPES